MSMNPTYHSGFASPQRGRMKYPSLWRGCVGAWAPCLGQTGLVLRDHSGFGNHGALTNGPVWDKQGGKQALSFDGVNDYVAITPISLGTTYTISFWMYATSTDDVTIAGDFSPASYAMYFAAAGWYHNVEDSYCLFSGISTASWQNKWTHVCIRRNGTTTIEAFRNGVSQGTATLSGGNNNLTLNRIGQFTGYAVTYVFAGMLDSIDIHKRWLSSTEIQILASRRGIAYELAPRRRSSIQVPANITRYNLFTGSSAIQIIGGAS